MRKLHLAVALSLVMAGAVSTPVWAQSQMDDPAMIQNETMIQNQNTVSAVDPDAFDTIQRPLTYTVEDDRIAAVTYLDDAIALLNLVETNIQSENMELARAALVGASGKLSNAYLLHFTDKQFSQDVGRLAMRADEALTQLERDPQQAAGIIVSMRTTLASAYQAQVAQMGGGAGAGLEDLDQLDQLEMEEVPMDDTDE